MNNNQLGREFEIELSRMLFDRHYWVHRLNANKSGQPADIIAVRNGKAWLIDCKHCVGPVFRLDRVEPNQQSAMDLWELSGNGQGWFALRFDGEGIYMVPHISVKQAKYSGGVLSLSDIRAFHYGCTLDAWLEKNEEKGTKWKLS